MRRLRRLALACLALICVFEIGAGIAVARMLPGRLDRWDVPRVGVRRLAAPPPPLRAADGAPSAPAGSAAGAGVTTAGVTAAGLTATLAALLSSPVLGPHVGMEVTNLATGQVLYARHATSGFAPASTTKLATAVAALQVLGPAARFSTRVVTGTSVTGSSATGSSAGGGTAANIVLVGGGDPTLAAGKPPASNYPQPATLAQLAARTARALRARGQNRVRVGYDTSLFTGPGLAKGWPGSYVTTGNVTPISPLEVDQGRLTASGLPEDADDPQNSRPRTLTPGLDAAHAFAGFLAADGIGVAGAPFPAVAPGGARTLARVYSPPVAQIAEQMLVESNNVIAENLARQVAIATGRPASFSGAAAAELAVLRRLGVTGVHLVDGSGLSPDDRITPATLVQLVGLAASPGRPRLRAAITGLPVAGFSGTLAPGGSVFAEAGHAALGVVRAKTGNLNTVASLAGIAYARDGQLLSFAVMTDQLRASDLNLAGVQIARVATALAGCGCRGRS
ncbi:MAG TPA: D-alanyl-D-alanine carboxypeptidase/D-alanyl-D-alanine-endopeptidase [Streptosporangiaceae bacterium]|nr:D-alanyl-D-alanine carboxypeptidase/D-alanyl-D-alanine-endopeptidase [Streptosporangiaceae bacterium]